MYVVLSISSISASDTNQVATYRRLAGLAVVMVGDRTDSATYVRMKQKAAEDVGIKFTLVHLPGDITEAVRTNTLLLLFYL